MFQVVGPALGCRFGEAEPVRPGSETGAKVQDGFLRNLRDPMLTCIKAPLALWSNRAGSSDTASNLMKQN